MRILFLDDMEVRHQVMRRRYSGHDLVQVMTAKHAIQALGGQERFDVVCLDHDLCEQHYLVMSEGLSEDPPPGGPRYDPGTGMDVVDHIITMPANKRPRQIIIHSWNIVRSDEMVKRLKDAGIPSTWIKFGRGWP